MNFTESEIAIAGRCKRLGLPWEPKPGHYVYDATDFCPHPSPFQERVYFILNYPYFMQAAGGVARFKEIMVWLPTWEDLRLILRDKGFDDREIFEYLRDQSAVERGNEREMLYLLVESVLRGSHKVRPATVCD